ncbi:hypothetical protein SESBI_51198, partial [Sesbania bispinosa]
FPIFPHPHPLILAVPFSLLHSSAPKHPKVSLIPIPTHPCCRYATIVPISVSCPRLENHRLKQSRKDRSIFMRVDAIL